MSEEKNVKKIDGVEEIKMPSLCAIPREFVVEKLEKLMKENQTVFEEYFMWVQVLNKEVKITGQDEQK